LDRFRIRSKAWSRTDANGVIGLDPANDGMIRGTVVGGEAGVCRVRISADADMGDGVKQVFGEYVDIQVTGGEATGFGSPVFGAPTDQP
jgi:DNA gyrase inhibitor GyrI